jgi:hypothetical protein
MRDAGPVDAKNSIESMLDKLLNNADSKVTPVDTRSAPPKTELGPVV